MKKIIGSMLIKGMSLPAATYIIVGSDIEILLTTLKIFATSFAIDVAVIIAVKLLTEDDE